LLNLTSREPAGNCEPRQIHARLGDLHAMTLPGPSRTIIVEPIEVPQPAVEPEPSTEPVEEPSTPAPEREPSPVGPEREENG
jgi:hypothetical protein